MMGTRFGKRGNQEDVIDEVLPRFPSMLPLVGPLKIYQYRIVYANFLKILEHMKGVALRPLKKNYYKI